MTDHTPTRIGLLILFAAVLGASTASADRGPRGERCASEGERCRFMGPATVYYGARNRWVKRHVNGTVKCDNATFGDPIVGVVKACFRLGGTPLFRAPRGERCAAEHGHCSFQGTATVYYGARHRWVRRQVTGGVACNNATFGDPFVGVGKTCFREGGHLGLTSPRGQRCASEGGYCSFQGTATVYYGTRNRWVRRQVTGGVACNNATFGDPLVGVAKACFRDGGSAPGGQVNGRNVRWVRCGSSVFRQKGAIWTERSNDGRFTWTEARRDEWSVYLRDHSRHMRLQLDLHTKRAALRIRRAAPFTLCTIDTVR